jgi:membrane-bound ClpP family serine protease
LLIYRQESLSLLGIPLSRYITIEDSEQILRAIRLTPPDVPIDLILHTPGGLVLATEQIARALIRHPAKVTVFVPHYAMSGGTMLALAADEIVMDANAVLGPVNPQLGNFPEEATELGMPITVGLPRQIYDLMELYPQPQGGRPTVQYISMPYGPMRPVLPEPKGRPLSEAGSTSEK